MTTHDPRLDWRPRHDPRSRNYGIRAATTPTPDRRLWNPPPTVLNQGQEGACVGFAWAAELAASPHRVKDINDEYARLLYRRAQLLDPWPDDQPYEGTSVLAGAQTCAERGLITEYRWAFNITDLRDAILTLGPAVIGIPWLEGMYVPRPSGLLDVTGPAVGGHAILVRGYHPRMRLRGEGWLARHEVFTLRNSWGPGYGKHGDVHINAADLATLLADNGEACIPTSRHT